MSREQGASSKGDGRSDLYSTGIMFYELVVGQPPFTASDADGPFTLMAKHVQAPPKPPSVHRPGLDMGLEEVILKSLSKRPEDPYQSGQEVDDAMCRGAARMPPRPRRRQGCPSTRRWRPRVSTSACTAENSSGGPGRPGRLETGPMWR